jgi:hypothetical protein
MLRPTGVVIRWHQRHIDRVRIPIDVNDDDVPRLTSEMIGRSEFNQDSLVLS